MRLANGPGWTYEASASARMPVVVPQGFAVVGWDGWIAGLNPVTGTAIWGIPVQNDSVVALGSDAAETQTGAKIYALTTGAGGLFVRAWDATTQELRWENRG